MAASSAQHLGLDASASLGAALDLGTHFPAARGSSHTHTFTRWASLLPPGPKRPLVATLAQQHEAKHTALSHAAQEKAARLRVANVDIEGRFVDGSGQVAVGKPDFDEFEQLRAVGQLMGQAIANTKKFATGWAHILNPMQTLPTAQAQDAAQATERMVQAMGNQLTRNPLTAAHNDSLSVRLAFDQAAALSASGSSQDAAQLRATASLGLLAGALGITRLFRVKGSDPTELGPRVDVVRSLQRLDPTDAQLLAAKLGRDRADELRVYGYEVPGRVSLMSTVHQGVLSNSIQIRHRQQGMPWTIKASTLDQALYEVAPGQRVFVRSTVKEGHMRMDVQVALRENGPGVLFQWSEAKGGQPQVNAMVVGPNDRAYYGSGKDILDALQARLWADGVSFSTVRHYWHQGTSDNFEAYRLNRAQAMPPEVAAANTWSGRYWSEAGFRKLRIVDQDESSPSSRYVIVDMQRE